MWLHTRMQLLVHRNQVHAFFAKFARFDRAHFARKLLITFKSLFVKILLANLVKA